MAYCILVFMTLTLFLSHIHSKMIDVPVQRILRDPNSMKPTGDGLMNLLAGMSEQMRDQNESSFLSLATGMDPNLGNISQSKIHFKMIFFIDASKYYEKVLSNYFNVQYYGTLYMGTH